ncbi:Exocyst complex component SEC3A [Rhynchospora pubera]|uniref:Exocyst complex component SEC3A n=1 Tax=Rhynchospora pubera TaxID=906938 RepID=A0AAV8DD36_9POAL|nr:Exocyst complex component SEC3A [Rhynchospora pubera]
MARSSADDMELKRQCEAAIDGSGGGKQKVVLCIRVAKSRAVWGKPAKLGRHMAKPRVLAISTKSKGQKTKAFLRVLKYSHGGVLEPAKIYKLKHLSKVEVMQSDASGCTFMLGFDNLRSQSVAPPQWTMRNKEDMNRVIYCILNLCKDVLGSLPKVVGMDIVEMALWAKEHTVVKSKQEVTPDGHGPVLLPDTVTEIESEGTIERDLVFQAEEEDMEALLGTYLLGFGDAEAFSERIKRELLALESANVHAILETESVVDEVLRGLEVATICMEDMDEWLAIFNVKLRHMREDIESIEYRNNKLEFQSENNKALVQELDNLLEHMQIPTEHESALTVGSFDEDNMSKNIEACEWLTSAIRDLELPNLDPSYAKMRAVREKRAEFILLRCTFVRRASEFLTQYFPTLIDNLINDQNNFSQKGQIKRPDHSELRYKCRVYARLLQHIKSLDKNCMGPLRMSYCQSLNQLLRKEVSTFANELCGSIKVTRNSGIPLEGPLPIQMGSYADSKAVSEAYAKLINVFIPLLVDESSFFSHLMCFESSSSESSDDAESTSSGRTSSVSRTSGTASNAIEMAMLNDCLNNMLKGIQDDFFAIIDWAANTDVWCCITMYGITDRYLSGQKAENAAFVHILLGDLESRINSYFNVFVDDACFQVEKYEKTARTFGVLAYIPRFSQLAMRLEEYVHGNSRDLIDLSYTKIVSIMFVILEKIAQVEPKYADIMLLENYASFQNGLYDLANSIPTLAKFYHQASEAYEQACLRHINMVIYIHYEKLFQFARRTEELLISKMPPEEIPFQIGMSKGELRKVLKSTISNLDKTQSAMYKKLQKNLTVEELIPSLWDKCKKEFLEKYASFVKMVHRIYPSETVPSEIDMQKILASLEML